VRARIFHGRMNLAGGVQSRCQVSDAAQEIAAAATCQWAPSSGPSDQSKIVQAARRRQDTERWPVSSRTVAHLCAHCCHDKVTRGAQPGTKSRRVPCVLP
jgi:hypothetical protein